MRLKDIHNIQALLAMLSRQRPWLWWFLVSFFVVGICNTCFLWTEQVQSEHMAPTLQAGDRVLIYMNAYTTRPPQRGDLVYLHQSGFIARVLAFAGETWAVQQGAVYVNGSPLPEDYVHQPLTFDMHPRTISAGNVVVLWDNRTDILPPREGKEPPARILLGAVPEETIQGRVMFCFYPFSRMRTW